MESHEWSEVEFGEKYFYRANYQSGTWAFYVTQSRRERIWTFLPTPSIELVKKLRDIVNNKYQRKRCPWQRVTGLDKLIEDISLEVTEGS